MLKKYYSELQLCPFVCLFLSFGFIKFPKLVLKFPFYCFGLPGSSGYRSVCKAHICSEFLRSGVGRSSSLGFCFCFFYLLNYKLGQWSTKDGQHTLILAHHHHHTLTQNYTSRIPTASPPCCQTHTVFLGGFLSFCRKPLAWFLVPNTLS